MLEHSRCVVLNASYEPLNIVSSRRGLMIVLKGKASIIEEHESAECHSATKKFPIPAQIVLKEFIKGRPAFRIPAQLTQRNLFVRDKNTCQYCSRTKAELGEKEFLTRDHVHPQVRGGRDIWTNVVTACNKCNNKKADYTLAELEKIGETGFRLKKLPVGPTIFEIWQRRSLRREN